MNIGMKLLSAFALVIGLTGGALAQDYVKGEVVKVDEKQKKVTIKHEPLTAQVSVTRTGEGASAQLVVEIQDVVSPTIMQRLNLEQGLFRAQITDWRAVVDCVLIDTQYDGQVFNVALADVPERKQDLVIGRYELPAPPAGSTVAVKIIDMLGEELVMTLRP